MLRAVAVSGGAPDLLRRRRELSRGDAAGWMILAAAALALAGALAIVLVIGRVPALSRSRLADPDLARRVLVVHVVLAAVVWQVSFIVGLFSSLPQPRRGLRARLARWLATLGVLAIGASVTVPSAEPILSNYVPVLDHGLFFAGIVAFTAAVTLTLLDVRLVAYGRDPTAVGHATRAAAATLLIAVATFVCAYLTDRGGRPLDRFERLAWGGGHVLQTSATMAMLAVWLALVQRLTGRLALSSRSAALLFASMLAPTLLGPWWATAESPHPGFTTMMQLGLFPFVGLVGGAAVVTLRRHATLAWSPATVGLATSAAMTLLGFVFAARIAGDTTLVPAHYHLNVGAVTVAFMTFLLVVPRRSPATRRARILATWQPLVYGAGQTVFASGLAVAGFWGGAARKVYGTEQALDTSTVAIGLTLAGIGGVLALGGGALFVALVGRSWFSRGRGRTRAAGPDRLDDRLLLHRTELSKRREDDALLEV